MEQDICTEFFLLVLGGIKIPSGSGRVPSETGGSGAEGR